VDAGVRAPCNGQLDRALVDLGQCGLELTLDGRLIRLPRPPAIAGPVVFEK
jgi:hypothetical protein